MRFTISGILRFVALANLLCIASDTLFAAPPGELDLTVLDAATGDPIAVRLRIHDLRGRTPRIRNVPKLGKDYTFSDLLTFKLKTGKYQFQIDRGPHYQQRTGVLEVKRDGFDQKTLKLPRFVDMRKEGWYGGDLLVARDPEQLALLADAEELDHIVVPAWKAGNEKSSAWKQRSLDPVLLRRADESIVGISDRSAGVAETDGGRFLAANLPAGTSVDPMAFSSEARAFADATRAAGGHICVVEPWAKDMPMLVAHGLVDSIAVLNDALQLGGDENERTGKPTDRPRFNGQHGSGRYAEEIYFHLLNCGLRIPPAALSNSGECHNPPGYNRVYVACGQDFSRETWWQNLSLGRAIVSNGPVLRARANERLPGHVFTGEKGREVELEVSCNLGTRQKVEYLELVKNGRVVESVRLDKWAKNGGRLPNGCHRVFRERMASQVRARAPGETNYRCAMTAPFFVEIDGTPRVSESSAAYFVEWVKCFDRAREIRRMKLPKEAMQQRIEAQRQARDYWQQLVDDANAP